MSRFQRSPVPPSATPTAATPRPSAVRVRHDEEPRSRDVEPQNTTSTSSRTASEKVAANTWLAWGLTPPTAPGWSVHTCPKCVRQDRDVPESLQMHDAGWFWCAQCGFHGRGSVAPTQFRGSWIGVWRLFLEDSIWSTDRPKDLKLPASTSGCQAPAWLGDAWVLAWHAFCRIDIDKPLDDALICHPETHVWSRSTWSTPVPLGWENLTGDRVVLVHDPLDMAVLEEAGATQVACLPPDIVAALPTSPAWRVLEAMEHKMKEMSSIVFAFKARPEERALEDELGRRMDRERCFRVRWHSPNDESPHEEDGPAEAVAAHGAEQVILMIDCAAPFPVVGLYELNDIDDRFDALYEVGLAPGEATGWPLFDQFYTVKPGQWTLVTGIPGHGKSSWLDALMVNLASMHGWRFGVFSPENQPIERHFASLMEKKVGKPFSEGPTPRITVAEKNATKRWLNDKFKVILPDEDNGVWSLDAVLRLAKILVYRYGIRGLVIDPWNELDHSRPGKMNETDHISESLTKVRRFARLYDVHIWIVAHPTKLEKKDDGKYPVATPYNVSGGAHWRNKADNAISVYRYADEEDADVVDIHVQKIRFREVGKLGVVSLRCEIITGRYIDDIDQEKRAYALGKAIHSPSSSLRLRAPRVYPAGDALEYEHRDIL